MRIIRVKKSELFPDGMANIYTMKEAVELNLKFRPYEEWPEAKYGEYVETYDDFVTPIIQRKDTGKVRYVKTPTGCFNIDRPRSVFDTEEFENRNSFTRKLRWHNDFKLNSNQQKLVDIFLKTLDIEFASKIAYPNWNAAHRRHYIPQIVKSPKFRKIVKSKFQEACENAGLTPELLIDKIKKALEELPSNSNNLPVMLKYAARAMGENFLEEKQLGDGKKTRALFEADDVEYEMVSGDNGKGRMSLVGGPVRDESKAG